MLRDWRVILAALTLLLVTLVVSAPARLLPLLLPGEQVQLAGLKGSLWRGSASRALVRTEAGWLHLGELQWALRPLSLLGLAPQLQVETRWGAQYANAIITLRGQRDIDLEAVDARIDASLLRQLAPVAVDGEIALRAEILSLRDAVPVNARGRLLWDRGAWLAPGGRLPLGSYELSFTQAGPGTPLTGEVTTVSGPVNAAGELALDGRDYRVDVRIDAGAGMDPRLRNALSLIARPAGDGYHLELNGAL